VLDSEQVFKSLRKDDTVVHLVGTPRPNPSKAKEFVRLDLPSIRSVVAACRRVSVAHLIYVSVAHPAPVMHAYIAARVEGEKAISDAGLTATIIRPWYVLGPGHRWPVLLVPLYAIAGLIPAWRPGAERLGLVTLKQMVATLARAIDDPPARGSIRIVDVPGIRSAHLEKR
jgi:uncharacterized protein YbjT (DUF2867 family)